MRRRASQCCSAPSDAHGERSGGGSAPAAPAPAQAAPGALATRAASACGARRGSHVGLSVSWRASLRCGLASGGGGGCDGPATCARSKCVASVASARRGAADCARASCLFTSAGRPPGGRLTVCKSRARNVFAARSESFSATDLCGRPARSGWWNLHLLPYVHLRPYGHAGGGSTREGGARRNASSVGPERPNGSSGGMKRSFTNEYMSSRSSTTFLNSGFSVARSR